MRGPAAVSGQRQLAAGDGYLPPATGDGRLRPARVRGAWRVGVTWMRGMWASGRGGWPCTPHSTAARPVPTGTLGLVVTTLEDVRQGERRRAVQLREAAGLRLAIRAPANELR